MTLFGDKPKLKVMSQKRKRHVFRQQTTTREQISVSAAGANVSPFIIYPPCLPGVVCVLDGSRNSLYGYSNGGYMITELLMKWLDHLHAPEERPLVLMTDQHQIHCGRCV